MQPKEQQGQRLQGDSRPESADATKGILVMTSNVGHAIGVTY